MAEKIPVEAKIAGFLRAEKHAAEDAAEAIHEGNYDKAERLLADARGNGDWAEFYRDRK